MGKMSREERDKFYRGLAILFTLLLFSLIFIYGSVSAVIDAYHYILNKKETSITSAGEMKNCIPGKPGTPYILPNTYNFSDMDKTLKRIERQLERIDKIREAEKGGDPEWAR